jgi:N utilization substance protein B
MGRRRLGRETAFKALYGADLTGKQIDETFVGLGRVADPEAVSFARELLDTVDAHGARLDEVLAAAADHWSLERMGVVDRSVLRLGTAEILYWPWIPDRVSIDEYVEIAKKYGTEHSGGFVNAILDRVSRDSETEESDAAAEGEPE